jgi:acetylglutamate kinase
MKITDLPHKQAKRYIEAFQDFQPHQQLLVKVGGGLLEDKAAVQELVEALTELAEHNIHTVLVHGGGLQLNEALKQHNVTPRFIDNKRYTDETTLKLAKATFEEIGDELVRTFDEAGIKSAEIPSTELFAARQDPKFGLVGTEITSIDSESIIDATQKHSVMVVGLIARNEETGGILNINADTIFRALATELKPHRMVSLTPTGGVLKPIDGSDTRELISGIDIRDIETLIGEGTVSGGMALKLRELATILSDLEIGSAISITKPSDLLLELLTDQGSGTFVGKGQKIIVTSDIGVLFTDLLTLIKEVFDKDLPVGYDKQSLEKIYFTPDHQAFGIITKLSDGTPYLDKLVVSRQLQGRGIGENLWYRIIQDFPVILWRSHITNRYATWYHRHADIMKRQGEWILFGKGIDFAALESMAEELVTIPAMH